MNSTHIYSENGVQWRRVFTVANAAVDSVKINAFSSKDFARYTNKKGKLGEIIDASKEMSLKRKDKIGANFDPVEAKRFENFSKLRKGKKCSQEKKQLLEKVVKSSKLFELK